MACDNFNRFYFCLWPATMNMSNNIRLTLALLLALTLAVARLFQAHFHELISIFPACAARGACGTCPTRSMKCAARWAAFSELHTQMTS